jgi:hypothetical protein
MECVEDELVREGDTVPLGIAEQGLFGDLPRGNQRTPVVGGVADHPEGGAPWFTLMGLIGAEVHHRVRGDSGLQFLVDLAEQGLGVGLARLAVAALEGVRTRRGIRGSGVRGG